MSGQVIERELGTVAGTSDGDWSGFASAQQLSIRHDASARETGETLSAGGATYGVTEYAYDALGRLECTAQRMNGAAWAVPLASACAPGASGSYGSDRIARTVYDAAGRVTKTQSAYGTADQSDDASAAYTANGEFATLSDANGNVTSYGYDGFDRLSATYYPVAAVGAGSSSTTDYEQFGYDASGNVITRRLRDGQVLGYQYDALGRRTHDDNPNTNIAEVDVTYSYDLLGRLLRAQDQNEWFSAYDYDALGRVAVESSNVSSNAYQYDLAGRLTRQTWADGFHVDYDHLVTGETSAIRENGASSGVGVLATYAYDDLGRRTGIVRDNGTSTLYGYDAASRLIALAHDMAGTAYDVSYGYGYNPAGQIVSRTQSNEAYAWAGALNRDDASGVNGLNQATTVGAGTLGYDARGNLTDDGGPRTFTYNTRNQLFTDGGGHLVYRGPNGLLGQLLYGSRTSLAFDNARGRLAAEYGNDLERRYVYEPGGGEPVVWYEGSGTGDRRFLHADERGSVVAVSDAAGNALAVNTYDEYGVPGSGNLGRFQYTGQAYIAELGLYDYKARMYSARLGRFLQSDPIGYGDGMNWYGYVGGDPVNATDPSGTFCSGTPATTGLNSVIQSHVSIQATISS